MISNEFAVTGMTCAHCEAAVRDEVSSIPGVESVQVSAADGRLVVTSQNVLADDVLAAVDEAGYTARAVR